jgi:hypothetical protein
MLGCGIMRSTGVGPYDTNGTRRWKSTRAAA